MYLVAIAWLYVTLMMALAEATSPMGSILGAIITFVLYGLLPLSILLYILATPARKRKLRARALAEQQAASSSEPDTDRKAPAAAQPGGIAAVREEC
ncbi:hypothetical protein [Comamonas composti]|uniref:hypothetical protein n=1 Tax=Comamonas composti TaxID=408558 RepID=UPI0009FD0355|nr:hypothetical protein [Comamonas composti]